MAFVRRSNGAEWSAAATVAVAMGVAQALAGLTALSHPGMQTTTMLMILTASMMATAILLVQVDMPAEAKAMLIGTSGIALLAAFMVQDVFRLQAIEQRMRIANHAAPAEPEPSRPRSGLTIQAAGGGSAPALANDVQRYADAQRGGGETAKVEVEIAVEGPAGGPSYRMTWAIRRGAERVWCGQMLAAHASHAQAVAQFGNRIAAARIQRMGEPIRCD